MESLAYTLGRIFMIWFAVSFLGVGLYAVIMIIRGLRPAKETIFMILGCALAAGAIIGIAFDFLKGPQSSQLATAVWKWIIDILNASTTSLSPSQPTPSP